MNRSVFTYLHLPSMFCMILSLETHSSIKQGYKSINYFSFKFDDVSLPRTRRNSLDENDDDMYDTMLRIINRYINALHNGIRISLYFQQLTFIICYFFSTGKENTAPLVITPRHSIDSTNDLSFSGNRFRPFVSVRSFPSQWFNAILKYTSRE